MSAKMQFLKKLQMQQSIPAAFDSKQQADIAQFRLRVQQLQQSIESWLKETGIPVESAPVSLTDLWVEGGPFDVDGIVLRYEDRIIKFTPLFLYGQGVKGCVEVSLCTEGKRLSLSRLFMSVGKTPGWFSTEMGSLSKPEKRFDEDVFFGMMANLLS